MISKQFAKAMPSMDPVIDFFVNSRYGERALEPGISDFTAGNPHEIASGGYIDALTKGIQPKDKDWFAYKMNEPDAQQAAADSLRQRLGIDFDPQDIYLTNAAFGAFAVILRLLLDQGDEVIFFSPPHFMYEPYVIAAGGAVKKLPMTPEWDLDLDALEGAITEKTRVVLVNSPNNPTGRIYPEATLQRLADILRSASQRLGRPLYLLSDEAYNRIVFDDNVFHSPVRFYEDSFLLYSYGKTLLAPGERVGYIAVPPTSPRREEWRREITYAQALLGWMFPNSVLQHALSDLERITIDLKHLQSKRDLMVGKLREFGYSVHVPEAALYLMPKSPIPDDKVFADKLAAEDVYVLPGSLMEIPGYFRISLSANDEMIERALPVFERAIS